MLCWQQGAAGACCTNPNMRAFLSWLKSFFGFSRRSNDRRRLMGMYFDESNSAGRRKPNRDRA
jgi:hypothetical protein